MLCVYALCARAFSVFPTSVPVVIGHLLPSAEGVAMSRRYGTRRGVKYESLHELYAIITRGQHSGDYCYDL